MRDIQEFDEHTPVPEEGTYWKDEKGHVYQVDYVSPTEWFVEIKHLEDGEIYHEQLAFFDQMYEPIITEDELGWCLLQGGS